MDWWIGTVNGGDGKVEENVNQEGQLPRSMCSCENFDIDFWFLLDRTHRQRMPDSITFSLQIELPRDCYYYRELKKGEAYRFGLLYRLGLPYGLRLLCRHWLPCILRLSCRLSWFYNPRLCRLRLSYRLTRPPSSKGRLHPAQNLLSSGGYCGYAEVRSGETRWLPRSQGELQIIPYQNKRNVR